MSVRGQPAADESTDDDGAIGLSRPDLSSSVTRRLYSQASFDRHFDADLRPERPSAGERLRALMRKCSCTSDAARRFFLRRFPIIDTLRRYSLRRDLPGDLMAGVTVGITNVQQGVANGWMATLTPVYGLYVSFYPALVYFFLATSLHNSIGVSSVISLMVGSTVESCMSDFVPSARHVSTDSATAKTTTIDAESLKLTLVEEQLQYRVGIATTIGFFTGIFQLAMALTRLGFVTIYMADPIISGFTTGVAVHVISSQMPTLFGINISQSSGALALIYSYKDFFERIHSTNVPDLVISLVSIVVLLTVKVGVNDRFKSKLKIPVPAELILVVIATIASYFANFHEVYGVAIVGDISRGLSTPSVPPMKNLPRILGSSFAIAIVTFAVSVSIAQVYAKKHSYEIEANQELLAYGVTNSMCSFFGCLPACASLSRSSIKESAGGRTPVADVVSSLLVLVVLLALAPYMKTAPQCVLSCIIVTGLLSSFAQALGLKTLWKVSKYDFSMWVITFLAVVIIDLEMGLLVGIAFGVLASMFRSQRALACLLGRINRTDIYRNVAVYKAAQEIRGIKIFRMDAPLYYVNAEHFRHGLYRLVGLNPRETQREREAQEAEVEEKKKQEAKARRRASSSAAGKQPGLRGALGPAEPDAERERTPRSSSEIVQPESTAAADAAPPPVAELHHIIIDCNPMDYIDSTGVKMLLTVHAEYRKVDIEVLFAGCRGEVRKILRRSGFYQQVSPNSLYIGLHDAVLAATVGDETAHEQLQTDIVVSDNEADLDISDDG